MLPLVTPVLWMDDYPHSAGLPHPEPPTCCTEEPERVRWAGILPAHPIRALPPFTSLGCHLEPGRGRMQSPLTLGVSDLRRAWLHWSISCSASLMFLNLSTSSQGLCGQAEELSDCSSGHSACGCPHCCQPLPSKGSGTPAACDCSSSWEFCLGCHIHSDRHRGQSSAWWIP